MLRDEISAYGEVEFASPASQADLVRCSRLLGHPVPSLLAELLLQSDGIEGEWGLGLLWNTSRIGRDNSEFRSDKNFRELYMSFDDLVFFADAGNGDQFAISLRGAQDVFVWNHEDDSRTWVASTPLDYLKKWQSGELKV